MKSSIVAIAMIPILASPLCQAFPTKPITLVVPTAAGGGNDAMARAISAKLSVKLGYTVIVDNKSGANGAIASEFVAKSNPDGYTLIFGYIATHAMNPALQKLRYDPVKDFQPIGLVAYSPTLMVANPKLDIKDARDLVAKLKAKPNSMNYASAGNGTAPHFAAELFKLATGTEITGVPYKGSAPALTDTLAGTTQMMFPSMVSAFPHVKAGKLRAIGVAGPKRSDALPEVPTLNEQGIVGVDVTQWYGIFAPANTPKPIVVLLNKTLNEILTDKDIVAKIEGAGGDVETSSPDELGRLVAAEFIKWKRVVEAAKLTGE